MVDKPTACSRWKIGAFADQVANGQRGAHEGGREHQQDQDLRGFVGCRRRAGRRTGNRCPVTVSDSAR